MAFKHLKWPGLTGDNTLIISVDKQAFGIRAKPLHYNGKAFVPKQEAHITIFGSEVGTSLLQQFIENPELEDKVHQAFESTDWSYQQTSDLLHLARTRPGLATNNLTEETIIMLVKMDGMAIFYRKLKDLGLIDSNHPVPPPHVTLYTRNIDRGIGVDSDDELAELSCGRVYIEG